MRFSHDVQGGFGGGQSLVRAVELPLEASDLGLLGGEFADLRAGGFAVEDAGVALLAPLGDEGGVEALAAQVGAAFVRLAGLLVGGQVRELVRRGE